MLYPSLWDSEKVGGLSDAGFRLYVYLITMADDFGKGDDVGEKSGQADGFEEAGSARQREHENLEQPMGQRGNAKRDA